MEEKPNVDPDNVNSRAGTSAQANEGESFVGNSPAKKSPFVQAKISEFKEKKTISGLKIRRAINTVAEPSGSGIKKEPIEDQLVTVDENLMVHFEEESDVVNEDNDLIVSIKLSNLNGLISKVKDLENEKKTLVQQKKHEKNMANMYLEQHQSTTKKLGQIKMKHDKAQREAKTMKSQLESKLIELNEEKTEKQTILNVNEELKQEKHELITQNNVLKKESAIFKRKIKDLEEDKEQARNKIRRFAEEILQQ